MTLFEDSDYVEWRPTPTRIANAMRNFDLDEEEIERTIAAVNLEALAPKQASKRWADLVRWASQDKWRGRVEQRRGAPEQTRPPVPAYVAEEVPDALSTEDLAARVAASRRRSD